MDGWDPMEDDYRSVTFNSYNRGPGRDLPLDTHPRFKNNQRQNVPPPSTSCYVVGVPPEISDQGLSNMFSEFGKVLRCHTGEPREGQINRYGFITYSTIREAEEAIAGIDRRPPHNMHVEFARSRNDQKRKEEAQNNEFESLKQQVYREAECTPRRPSNSLLGNPPKHLQRIHSDTESITDQSNLGNLPKIQVRIHGENKVVSYSNNNNQEEENHQRDSNDKCIVEHFTTYGSSNRASSRASVAGVEIRNTDCGLVERRVLDSSEEYKCSFVTPQLVQLPCTYCKKPGGFRCPRCKAWYCGQSCQLSDWPQHKLKCRLSSQDTESVKGYTAATNHFNNSDSSNGPRQNHNQNNSSQHNRNQKENSEMFRTNHKQTHRSEQNCEVNDTPRGPQRSGGAYKPLGNQRDPTPAKNYGKSDDSGHFKRPGDFGNFKRSGDSGNFKRPDDSGHFKRPDVPKPDRVRNPSQSSCYSQEKDKANAAVPDRPQQNSHANGSENCNDQGRGRAVRNCFPNGTKELRRPLRKPGETPMEAHTQAQSSVVTEFFRSGSCKVRVCHAVSPDEFYIQKTCNDDALSTLLVELHQEATCGKPLNVPLIQGDHCMALYSDGMWHRARVLKVLDSKSHEVYLVDNGNKHTVQLENMRLLPVKFRALPEQALCCSMDKISPLTNNWDESSITNFKILTADEILTANLQSERNGTAVVDLEDRDGCLVSRWMMDLGSAKEAEAPPPHHSKPVVQSVSSVEAGVKEGRPQSATQNHSSTAAHPSRSSPTSASAQRNAAASPTSAVFKPPLPSVFDRLFQSTEPVQVTVTWIVDERNFWVFVDDPELKLLVPEASEVLFSASNSSSFTPSIGQAVGAKSSDGSYYRALLKQKLDAKSYKVLFLDFGNEEDVTCVTPLPQALAAFASPALQLQSSQSHNFEIDNVLTLAIESIDKTQVIFSVVGTGVKLTGKPWFAGHISPEKSLASPPVPLPIRTSPEPVLQKSHADREVSRHDAGGASACVKTSPAKPPLPSFLSSLRVQTEPIRAVVTWIVDSKNFWVSIVDEELTLKVQDISVSLTASHDKDCVGFSALSGQLVNAKSSDQTCYRAYIKSRSKAGTYCVLFLDYGNVEEVPVVAPLPPQALTFPSAALQMIAAEPLQVTENQFLYLRIAIVETSFVTFTQLDENGHEVTELVGKPWYSGHIVDTDSGVSCPGSALEETLVMFTSMPQRQFDNSFKAMIPWAHSAREIYILRATDEAKLKELMRKVNETAGHVKERRVPIFGQVVLALFAEDGLWYRAKVLGVSAKEALVHFIDYGNQAQVTLDELQLCPAELSREAPFAIHVAIEGMDSISLEQAQELTENIWNVEVVGKAHGLPCVRLNGPNGRFGIQSRAGANVEAPVPVAEPATAPVSSSNTTIAPETSATQVGEIHSAPCTPEEFSTDLYSDKPFVDIPQGAVVNLVISSVSSPDLIFVNYFASPDFMDKWNTLVTEIQTYCAKTQPPADYEPEPARFCLAKFSEDQLWYRAVVLAMVSDSPRAFKVLFVDYGNMETVSEPVRPIPARFMELPLQAVHSKLYGIMKENIWSEEVCAALRAAIMGKTIEVHVARKDEDSIEIDIPAVRKELIDKGLCQPDPEAVEQDTNTLSAVTNTELCAETEAVASNSSGHQSGITEEMYSTSLDTEPATTSLDTEPATTSLDTEPATTSVDTEPATTVPEASTSERSAEEELREKIRMLEEQLASLKSK